MANSLIKNIKIGIDYAVDDYRRIASLKIRDVKPKEDQLKCAIYRSLSEAGYLVHVEARDFQGYSRIDLLSYKGRKTFAIEIKTSWCGPRWVNKYAEQAGKWVADISRISDLMVNGHINDGLFVLALAYREGYSGLDNMRMQIDGLTNVKLLHQCETVIDEWNGLDKIEFLVWRVVA